jgi:hypothetical protein
MAFKLMESASKGSQSLNGSRLLAEVRRGSGNRRDERLLSESNRENDA